MWTLTGPWCDDEFTDTAVLGCIAAENSKAALGALRNKNLTGEALKGALSNATFAAKVLDDYNQLPGQIMQGRTSEDQVAIVMAVAKKSSTYLSNFATHLTIDALLELVERAKTQTIAQRALDATGRTVEQCADVIKNPDHPRFEELLSVFDVKETDAMWLKYQAWKARGDKKALRALASTIANFTPGMPRKGAGVGAASNLVQTLLLATQGHPEVVAHWATKAGKLGQLVAANDHRQPQAVYEKLTELGARAYLTQNPGVSRKLRLQVFGEIFADAATENESLYAAGGSLTAHARKTLPLTNRESLKEGGAADAETFGFMVSRNIPVTWLASVETAEAASTYAAALYKITLASPNVFWKEIADAAILAGYSTIHIPALVGYIEKPAALPVAKERLLEQDYEVLLNNRYVNSPGLVNLLETTLNGYSEWRDLYSRIATESNSRNYRNRVTVGDLLTNVAGAKKRNQQADKLLGGALGEI